MNPDCSELEYFQKMFTRRLYIIFISQCTSRRLQILKDKKKTTENEIRNSTSSEIMLTLGCLLVMSYNKLCNVYDYWSPNPSKVRTIKKLKKPLVYKFNIKLYL